MSLNSKTSYSGDISPSALCSVKSPPSRNARNSGAFKRKTPSGENTARDADKLIRPDAPKRSRIILRTSALGPGRGGEPASSPTSKNDSPDNTPKIKIVRAESRIRIMSASPRFPPSFSRRFFSRCGFAE